MIKITMIIMITTVLATKNCILQQTEIFGATLSLKWTCREKLFHATPLIASHIIKIVPSSIWYGWLDQKVWAKLMWKVKEGTARRPPTYTSLIAGPVKKNAFALWSTSTDAEAHHPLEPANVQELELWTLKVLIFKPFHVLIKVSTSLSFSQSRKDENKLKKIFNKF